MKEATKHQLIHTSCKLRYIPAFRDQIPLTEAEWAESILPCFPNVFGENLLGESSVDRGALSKSRSPQEGLNNAIFLQLPRTKSRDA